MGFAARSQTVTITGTVARNDVLKFPPVDGAVIPMRGFLIPLQIGVRNLQIEILRLRNRCIDEFLTKIVVGKSLDLPARGLIALRALLIG